jgi:hypothetical protein
MMQWCIPTFGQRMPLHNWDGSTTIAIIMTATPKSATSLWIFFKKLTIIEAKVFDYAYSRIHSQTKRKKSQPQSDAVCKNEGHLSRSQMVDVEVWHHTRRSWHRPDKSRVAHVVRERKIRYVTVASYHRERKDPLKDPLEDPFQIQRRQGKSSRPAENY